MFLYENCANVSDLSHAGASVPRKCKVKYDAYKQAIEAIKYKEETLLCF